MQHYIPVSVPTWLIVCSRLAAAPDVRLSLLAWSYTPMAWCVQIDEVYILRIKIKILLLIQRRRPQLKSCKQSVYKTATRPTSNASQIHDTTPRSIFRSLGPSRFEFRSRRPGKLLIYFISSTVQPKIITELHLIYDTSKFSNPCRKPRLPLWFCLLITNIFLILKCSIPLTFRHSVWIQA
jgi:hypothetical protein